MSSNRTVLIPVYARTGIVGHIKVDEADAAFVQQWRWSLMFGYAKRSSIKAEAREHTVLLHRELMGCVPGDGWDVDHIDRDRLNDTRANLRKIPHAGTPQNTFGRVGATSRFRGVSWSKARYGWLAQAKLYGKVRNLGVYETEEEAAEVARLARLNAMKYAVD